jgi:heme-degrading monooxygenase HmoA
MEKAFEAAYGPDGDWARLFKHDDGYLGTELIRDLKDPRRYLTMDFWISARSYENFREHKSADYKKIDKMCEAMTNSESEAGRFERR